ncbi:MBL fold metallo-hydrolase [Nocardioides alcanivorans]|uniref:MBL fold metallo-hydrolase n=1 Tax=Nocardioides alcanivorans TaxID=2897352 RepID=UPI001F397357|nr:MBL fold metallo-hydrolase [Nocardioides alcanivorans]
MRLPWGRPDISQWAELFDVPPVAERPTRDAPAVTFLGVSTLLFDDGESALMFDGFFSRPSLVKVGVGKVAPDAARIDAALERLGLGPGGRSLDAVVPVHSHFDHVMDAAMVARRTDAVLVGGASTDQVGIGGGLPQSRRRIVQAGETVRLGNQTLCFIGSAHCPPDRYPGVIETPVVPPVKAAAYRCGETWSVVVRHDSGRSALVQGSAGFVPQALDGCEAEVVYLGVGQLGKHDVGFIADYWTHTVRAVGARRVVLTHWDDFFRPLDLPLRALPYAGDDLAVTMGVLQRLAADDGVSLHFPTVWQTENPWAPS